MASFWISFSDPERPVGSKFLGVVIVEAADEDEAIALCTKAGFNPGGDIAVEDISARAPPREWFDRFLSPKESRDANRVMCKMAQAEEDEDY